MPNTRPSIDRLKMIYCDKEEIDSSSVIIIPSDAPWASNRYPCQITIEGQVWESTEAFMQAEKLKHLQLKNIPQTIIERKLSQIRESHDATESVKMTCDNDFYEGKSVNDLLDQSWHETYKYNTISQANKAKFTQNKDLCSKILSTGNTILIGIGGHHSWAAITSEG